jgi:hypothetical protein
MARMGFDLCNDAGEEFQFNNAGWRCVMEFAASAGFVWPGDDDQQDMTRLTAEQALALADAIDRGIGMRASIDAAKHASELLTRRLVVPSKSPLFRNDPIVIQEKTINYWREFANFARAGGFSVDF